MKQQITFEQFMALDLRIGTIEQAEKIEGSFKLIKLMINFGNETRQIIAGIGEIITDLKSLIGQQIPVLVNLEPKMIKGYESQGMILACDDQSKPILLHPEVKVSDGSIVR